MEKNSNEKNDSSGVEKIRKLSKRLQSNQEALRISRVPKKTKETFIKLAEEEFCGDYGMTLKFLAEGIIDQRASMMIEKINELEDRIIRLEEIPNEKNEGKRKIKKLDGKLIDMPHE